MLASFEMTTMNVAWKMFSSSLLLLLSTVLILQLTWTTTTRPSAGVVHCATSNSNSDNYRQQDIDQLIQQSFPQTGPELAPFDASQFTSIYEAIRAHPDLREFGSLCEAKGVKEIVGMDRTQVTVFAPIDRPLAELLAKTKQRQLNLVELAKQHIVQGFVVPDEQAKYPVQLSSYAALSPIYLNQVVSGANRVTHYVNNAKILATYLIQIDPDNYQTLHLIDLPLDFVYLNKRTQIRSPSAPSNSQGSTTSGSSSSFSSGSSSSGSSSMGARFASVKRPLNLDELAGKMEAGEQAQAIKEFHERFGHLSSMEARADLFHVRSGSRTAPTLTKEQLNLERLAKFWRSFGKFKGKLYALNETTTTTTTSSSVNSLNTYFLPINSDELDNLLDADDRAHSHLSAALEAHIIPNQVLFTRQMSLGEHFDTSLSSPRVSLNLAKTINGPEVNLLATPLLVQARCEPAPPSPPPPTSSSTTTTQLNYGLTQTEVLVANIPLANGVLHLIKRPLVLTDQVSLLDYLNDSDNQLSDVVQAIGSRSANSRATPPKTPIRLNRFRELLARERQLLASLTGQQLPANATILAPSDEAFSRLRYELRALIEGDDSLVPSHWDDSYKQDLLERLVKRHIIAGHSLTSAELGQLATSSSSSLASQPLAPLISSSGQLISFKLMDDNNNINNRKEAHQLVAECDSSRPAKLIETDLVTSNGLLHIVDSVLGEDQETIHSLLRSLILRQEIRSAGGQSAFAELANLIESNLRQLRNNMQEVGQPESQADRFATGDEPSAGGAPAQPPVVKVALSPELSLVSKTIGQFLEELSPASRHSLATSVNVSFQLAKLASQAENQVDWNERFKQVDGRLTYFIPSDLAWLRLQHQQPELYKALNYFLSASASVAPAGDLLASRSDMEATSATPSKATATTNANHQHHQHLKSSESSHRLLQILERHLVANRRIGERDLRHQETIETMGATLRVVEQPREPNFNHQVEAANSGPMTENSAPGAFAALHSILGGPTHQQQQQQQQPPPPPAAGASSLGKALQFNKVLANLVQVNETSNGYLYLIDYVLVEAEDSSYLQQTSPGASSAILSASMSSLLGAHNSAILEFIQNFVSPSSQALNLSISSMLTLIGTLTLAILILLIVTVVLVLRRHQQNKLNHRHEQLESGGMTSASSANSGSTSTTKSL